MINDLKKFKHLSFDQFTKKFNKYLPKYFKLRVDRNDEVIMGLFFSNLCFEKTLI